MIPHERPTRPRTYPGVCLLWFVAVVFLSGCGGGSASTAAPPTTNPMPAIAAVSPATLTAGASGSTVTIMGSGFIQSSTAEWNQSSRATTFVSATELQVALTTADLASGGTGQITVVNPAPGGGASGAAMLTVDNPTPTLAGISPASVTALNAGAVLTLTGSGFVTSSVVTWNGTAHTSTFVSATQLQLALTAADVASAGTVQIAVVNPTPGGGSATPNSVTIIYPVPSISSLSPSKIASGAQPLTLTINGAGFVASSVVQLNGTARPTVFVSGNTLTTALSAADTAAPGTIQISVSTGAPGGGVSAPVALTISNYATPTITSLTPSSIPIGSQDSLIDVLGSGFTSASTVQVNAGTAISTNSSNPGELFFTLPSADLTTLGTLSITVTNPGPLTSNALTINVVPHPLPVLTNLSPASAAMGGPDFLLTLTGSGFVPTSVVQWNGAARPTVFNSPNQLTATIPAGDIQSLGNNTITVFSPTPGGGTSGPATFTTFLSLANNDLIYDASRKLFWTSVPSSVGPPLGNSVVSIDPYTGSLGTPIWVGSEPNKLAISSDATTLWVSFSGSPSARKIDLTNGVATATDLYFPGGWGGNTYATSLAALPGAPSSVAVAPGLVQIYDNAVGRPKVSTTGATYLAFGATSSTLFGYSNTGLSIFSVDSTGIASTNTPPSSGSYSNDLRYDKGRLYLTSGGVLDAISGTLLGTFAAAGPVASDSTLGRAFILNQSGIFGIFDEITAFNESTFVPVGSFPVAGITQAAFNTPSSLVRWGENGLAFRTNTQIYVLTNALVQDLSATPADLAVSLNAPSSSLSGTNSHFRLR